MKIRIEGLPTGVAPAVVHEVEFMHIEGKGDDLTSVYRYLQPVGIEPSPVIEGIPAGIRLIGDDLHQLQYTHTRPDGVDVYRYVESVHTPSDHHVDFVNELLALAPEAYDDDAAAEAIALKFVQDLIAARDQAVNALGELVANPIIHPDTLRHFAQQTKSEITERTRTIKL